MEDLPAREQRTAQSVCAGRAKEPWTTFCGFASPGTWGTAQPNVSSRFRIVLGSSGKADGRNVLVSPALGTPRLLGLWICGGLADDGRPMVRHTHAQAR